MLAHIFYTQTTEIWAHEKEISIPKHNRSITQLSMPSNDKLYFKFLNKRGKCLSYRFAWLKNIRRYIAEHRNSIWFNDNPFLFFGLVCDIRFSVKWNYLSIVSTAESLDFLLLLKFGCSFFLSIPNWNDSIQNLTKSEIMHQWHLKKFHVDSKCQHNIKRVDFHLRPKCVWVCAPFSVSLNPCLFTTVVLRQPLKILHNRYFYCALLFNSSQILWVKLQFSARKCQMWCALDGKWEQQSNIGINVSLCTYKV